MTRCARGSARSRSTPPRPSATTRAGTIEGLLQDGEYFFLEMNTRVQVEHCVTEAVSGIDIVREQILIAAGEPLSYTQDRSTCAATRSSAASTPRTRRRTSPPPRAASAHYREPAGPGVRVDSGVLAGSEITPLYDPMVAKLIVWDVDRERATRADAARARRVRDRGRHDPDPVPQGDHGLRAVGQRRDLPRPHRGPQVAQDARPAEAPEAGARTSPSRSSAPTPSRSPASASTSPSTASRWSPPANGAAPAQARKPRRRERAKASGGGGGATS